MGELKPGDARRIEKDFMSQDHEPKTLSDEELKSLKNFKTLFIDNTRFASEVPEAIGEILAVGQVKNLNESANTILKGDRQVIKNFLGISTEADFDRVWHIAAAIIARNKKLEEELPVAEAI